VTRVPAADIDAAVVAQVRHILQSPEVVAETLCEAKAINGRVDERQAINALMSVDQVWENLIPSERARIIRLLVDRVEVSPNGIRVDLRKIGLQGIAVEATGQTMRRAA
jgi:hypothetical protein